MSDSVAAAFGELLLAARKEAGMSQEELAHLSGLDRSTISLIERGQVASRVATLIQVAGALDVDPCGLLPPLRWKPPAPAPEPKGAFERIGT